MGLTCVNQDGKLTILLAGLGGDVLDVDCGSHGEAEERVWELIVFVGLCI